MPIIVAGPTIASSAQIAPGTILDSDINAAAAIAYAKLALSNSIVNGDISAAAAIALSKLANGTQGGVPIRTSGGVMSELGAGTDGQVLTSKGAGNDAVWQSPEAPTLVVMATVFETAARFSTGVTGAGSIGWGQGGVGINTSSGSTAGSGRVNWEVTPKASTLYTGSPIFTCRMNYSSDVAFGTTGSVYMGLGEPTVGDSGHTFTVDHAGFKLVKGSGTITLYATQANGTTESASSALTTLANGDFIDLVMKIRGTSSIDYYWSKNGGAWSAVTTLNTNMPSGSSQKAQFSTSGGGTNCWNNVGFQGATYSK